MKPKVEFNNVNLIENNFQIINNVNLSLEDNKIIGLIGRNGAGKTSLLSMLASYRITTNGKITIDGEEAFENEDKMEQVTFIYPSDYSEETETLKEIFEEYKQFKKSFDEAYARQLMNRFNLPMDKAISELSKGMQSAMNVSFGLASRSPITVFDEAYLSMDAPSRQIFYDEVMEEQTKHPRLFIISTHLVSEAEYLFDEIVMIHNGKLKYHEEYESMVSKGATVTGSAETVAELVEPYEQLKEEILGPVKSVTVYGIDLVSLQEKAQGMDVEIGPVSLQPLFNYLTEERD